MTELSNSQHELISKLTARLSGISGIQAVVLGGSFARGRAQPGSDIDLGIFYSETAPFAIDSIRDLARSVHDAADPVVSGFYEWGQWVNGGAWLSISGQRVDFIYRSIEHVERVIADTESGRYEIDYLQQPPFGFFSGTYPGEIAICKPVVDPNGLIDRLKVRVEIYPERFRERVIQDFLWMAEFGLELFARKFASRCDIFGTVSCMTRAIHQLELVLFALNRRYPVNDKTMLAEITEFELAPERFSDRVQHILKAPGMSAAELHTAVDSVKRLAFETMELTGGLYRSRYEMPG